MILERSEGAQLQKSKVSFCRGKIKKGKKAAETAKISQGHPSVCIPIT